MSKWTSLQKCGWMRKNGFALIPPSGRKTAIRNDASLFHHKYFFLSIPTFMAIIVDDFILIHRPKSISLFSVLSFQMKHRYLLFSIYNIYKIIELIQMQTFYRYLLVSYDVIFLFRVCLNDWKKENNRTRKKSIDK